MYVAILGFLARSWSDCSLLERDYIRIPTLYLVTTIAFYLIMI